MAAVIGWVPAYYITILMCGGHWLYYVVKERSVTAFPAQVRLGYLLLSLFGLWPEGRRIAYFVLMHAVFMVVLFERCIFMLMLKQVPANRLRGVRLY